MKGSESHHQKHWLIRCQGRWTVVEETTTVVIGRKLATAAEAAAATADTLGTAVPPNDDASKSRCCVSEWG